MRIGIIALQGAFEEHKKMLDKIVNTDSFFIKTKDDLRKEMDGIILPGGESTSIGQLLKEFDMHNRLKYLIEDEMPIFGTCAGMILLSKKTSDDEIFKLETFPANVKRNAYGRQLGSFNTFDNFEKHKNVPMIFIRAPYIESVENNVEILSCVKEKIVAAKYKKQLVTAFHPELTNFTGIHEYFLNMI